MATIFTFEVKGNYDANTRFASTMSVGDISGTIADIVLKFGI